MNKKKTISVLLILALSISSVAFAAETLTFTAKNGTYAAGLGVVTKASSTGTAAKVDVGSNPEKHSIYYQIHKSDNIAASNYKNTTGTGVYSLTYKTNNNGSSLGRKGYKYKLRVAHRSQCTCSDGHATIVVNGFTP